MNITAQPAVKLVPTIEGETTHSRLQPGDLFAFGVPSFVKPGAWIIDPAEGVYLAKSAVEGTDPTMGDFRKIIAERLWNSDSCLRPGERADFDAYNSTDTDLRYFRVALRPEAI